MIRKLKRWMRRSWIYQNRQARLWRRYAEEADGLYKDALGLMNDALQAAVPLAQENARLKDLMRLK